MFRDPPVQGAYYADPKGKRRESGRFEYGYQRLPVPLLSLYGRANGGLYRHALVVGWHDDGNRDIVVVDQFVFQGVAFRVAARFSGENRQARAGGRQRGSRRRRGAAL